MNNVAPPPAPAVRLSPLLNEKGGGGKYLQLITIAALILTLGSGIAGSVRLTGQVAEQAKSPLQACEGNEALFPRDIRVPKGQTLAAQWAKRYHDRVRTIVEDHLKQLRRGGTCDESTRTSPTKSLQELATLMKEGAVHAEDTARLLLRHLELYECTLQSSSFIIEAQTAQTLVKQNESSSSDGDASNKSSGVSTIAINEWATAIEHERHDINLEFRIARPSLHRTLVYLSGLSRFQPLESALTCVADATVDIRNSLGLAAEASACLPKVWDARTSLRTLSPPQSTSSGSPDASSAEQ